MYVCCLHIKPYVSCHMPKASIELSSRVHESARAIDIRTEHAHSLLCSEREGTQARRGAPEILPCACPQKLNYTSAHTVRLQQHPPLPAPLLTKMVADYSGMPSGELPVQNPHAGTPT